MVDKLGSKEIFISRWPEFASCLENGHAGAVDDLSNWFKEQDLGGVQILIIYGLGSGGGYKAAQKWLRQDATRHLVIMEDDPLAISDFLCMDIAENFLNDTQAVLFPFFRKEPFDFGSLSREFRWLLLYSGLASTRIVLHPAKQSPFAEALRNQLHAALVLFNRSFREFFVSQAPAFTNFYRNLRRLPKAASALGYLQEGLRGIPAVICGAGPSIMHELPAIQRLVQENRAVVFASGGGLNVLTNHSIMPHLAAAIDPTLEQVERQKTHTGFHVPVFYRSRYHHEALELITAPLVYVAGSGELDVAGWFEKRLGLTDPKAPLSGVSTSNFCAEVAVELGCNPIILVGMDLAYTGGKRYAEGIDGGEIAEKQLQAVDSAGNPIQTKWGWVHEAGCFTALKRRCKEVSFFNATRGGLPILDYTEADLAQKIEELPRRQGDLAENIAQLIREHPLPKGIGQTLDKVIEEWMGSLLRSKALVLQLQILFAEMANEEKTTPASFKQEQDLHHALEREPVYRYLLEKLEEVYTDTQFRERILYKWHASSFTGQERRVKELQWQWTKMVFLQEALKTHIEALNAREIA